MEISFLHLEVLSEAAIVSPPRSIEQGKCTFEFEVKVIFDLSSWYQSISQHNLISPYNLVVPLSITPSPPHCLPRHLPEYYICNNSLWMIFFSFNFAVSESRGSSESTLDTVRRLNQSYSECYFSYPFPLRRCRSYRDIIIRQQQHNHRWKYTTPKH